MKRQSHKQLIETPGDRFMLQPRYYLSESQKVKLQRYLSAVGGVGDSLRDDDGGAHPLQSALQVVANNLHDLYEEIEKQALPESKGGAS